MDIFSKRVFLMIFSPLIFKGRLDQNRFIFESNVPTCRKESDPTKNDSEFYLQSNLSRSRNSIQFLNRFMSDPSLSDIDSQKIARV